MRTPWGPHNYYEKVDKNIIVVSTPGHGGYRCKTSVYLDACERLNVPVKEKNDYDNEKYTWFEEDCDWAFLALAIPSAFSDKQIDSAHSILKNYFPLMWEKWQGRELLPGESAGKDEITFYNEHKDDYLVISALGITSNLVFTHATLGADRTGNSDSRAFLVDPIEYEKRKFNYIITDKDIEVDSADENQNMYKWLDEGRAIYKSLADSGEFIVRDVKIHPDGILLKCLKGTYDNGERLEVIVSNDEWKSKDPLDIHCVVNENGEWHMQKIARLDIPVVEKQEIGMRP